MTSIRKGTRLLDEVYPEWYEWIDLDTLDLQFGDRCVLGQIEKHLHPRTPASWRYEKALARLGIWSLETAELGFSAYGNLDVDWASLTARWKQAIRRRRRGRRP